MIKSVDRVQKALELEETDMIPQYHLFTTDAAVIKNFGAEQFSGMDWKEKSLFLANFFENDIIEVAFHMGLFDSMGKVLVDESDHFVFRTPFGGVAYFKKEESIPIILHHPIRTEDDLPNLEVPDPEDFKPKVEELAEAISWFAEKGFFVQPAVLGPFYGIDWYFRGTEKLLMDIVLNPSFVKKMVDLMMKPVLEFLKMLCDEAPVSGVRVADDYAAQDHLFFSPNVYNELFRPWNEKIVKELHKRDIPVFVHSHGNVNLILEDLVNTGFDCIDPWDPDEGMDIGEGKKKYGDRIALRGGITKRIGQLSREEIKDHVEDRIRLASPGGGFILGMAGGVPFDMDVENVRYYVELAKKLRRRG